MPIIRITAFQRFLQQQCLNVYYYDYQGELSPPIFNNLRTEFQTRIIDVVRTIQSNQLVYEELEIVDMSDPNGLYARYPLNIFGTVSGEILPSFVAWSFKALVATRATRPGGKRIAGVAESSTGDGLTPASTFAPTIEAARVALGRSLETPAGVFAFPAVVSFQPRVPGQTPTIRATQFIREYTVARLTSQVTRRVGRGS